MCHLKVECVLRTFEPNVCVTNDILSPLPQRQGDVGLACTTISDNPSIHRCLEVSVLSCAWKDSTSASDLGMLAMPGRYLSEPHALGIWDGNLLRIASLTKFPISLVFGRA